MLLRESPSGPLTRGTANGQVLTWNEAGDEWEPETFDGLLPGAPIYDVMAEPFNAAGDGVADDTAAINAAIAAANLAPGSIYLGNAHRITGPLSAITANNVIIRGRGEFNGGSRIVVDSAGNIDAVTFGNCQYGGIDDVWIVGTRVYSGGWGITLNGCFRTRVNRCVVSEVCFGLRTIDCNNCYVDKVNLTNLWGVFMFFAAGTGGGNFNHAITFRSCIAGTNYPNAIVGSGAAWAPLTAYIVGNVVVNSGGIYQCVVAGTSAAAGGPLGIPSTDPATAHTTQIVDGSVRWVFAMPAFVGWLQGSYAQTFECIDCGVLQGLFGFSMEDTTPGAGSEPLFARFDNFQVDHTLERGIRLVAGGAARFSRTFVTSIFGGSGIEIASGFDGNWEFIGGEIFGCADAGITIARGDGCLMGLQIGACSGRTSNTRDCIEVSNSSVRWSIIGCSGGQMTGGTSPATRFGLSIAAGCNNYVVCDNRFEGNLTGSISNVPGVASTRVVRENIPDSGISPGELASQAAGTSLGRQIDAGSGTPVALTGAEQVENQREATVQTISNASGTLDIALNDDTTVLLIRTTADATLRTLGTTAPSSAGRKVTIEHDRQSGTGNLTVAHNTAGTFLNFFNPRTQNIVLGQTQLLEVRERAGFWRPKATAGIPLTMAVISVPVPAVPAATLAYLNVSTVGTPLAGIGVGNVVTGNPTADLAAAGAGNGNYVGCRVSAADTLRLTFQGALASGNVDFQFVLLQ